MTKIYYDVSHPAGFSSISRLTEAMRGKLKRKDVTKWLQSQETYTLHKPSQKHFPRNKYILSNYNELWQADLSDMRTYSKYNDGYKYILCVIDVFSKYAFARAMKNKKPDTIKTCFDSIFAEAKATPRHIQSDKGTEFVSKNVRDYFKSKNINYYTTNNPDIKASIVERFQRTLKMKMWRYFTFKNTHKYINILQDLLHSYNHSFHTSIKMTPSEVNCDNIMTVWQNLYGKKENNKYMSEHPSLQIGDHVRITRHKHIFEKGYETNWSEEIFVVDSIIRRSPWIVYTLRDLENEPITGTFYSKELQKVFYDPTTKHKIDKIIESRRVGGRKEVLVKWKGYPSKFNSWIPASDIKEI